ncbi:MAG: alcohol dehydrogenase catalytic domain-containing protein [Anaerolineae bacterium]|nr:alcohol dehydrogenase catalytic domain-containing protein [Anaerolineae bacterium]
MKAIRFNATIPRYAAGLAMSRVRSSLLWSGRSCTYVEEVPVPDLIGPDWVRIRTRLGGICGTDIGTIHLHTSPYFSPFASFPYTIGHENVGVIAEVGPEAGDWQVGQRVVVEPLLWCAPRGFSRDQWCPNCARGEINQCQRVTEGNIAPGIIIGSCRDTGGSWSQSFVAHRSQLFAVPDHVSDENALMVEPFAVGLHPALSDTPGDDETVLILGAGTIGLCMLAALRAVGCQATILVAARYPFQIEAARRLGASDVLTGDLYDSVASRTGATLHKPIIGKRVVSGGVDRTYDCVGSDATLDDSLRLTRSGGKVILVGVPGIAKGVDWTAIFAQELTLRASYIYNNAEQWRGQTVATFDVALELIASGQVDLGWMVTHRFPLDKYSDALALHGKKGSSGLIKAVFEFP